jgi:mono/diheme cytochrome c family protein
MSVFAGNALQISTLEPRFRRWQFHTLIAPGSFALCRPAGVPRNDVALSPGRIRAIMPQGKDKLVQGRQRAMRAILAIVFLCTAFTYGKAQPQPSAETIARGKALTEAADCASCHTADPSKPFGGGKRIDTPFGGIYSPNLTPDRDTGIGAWSDGEFHRALHYGVAPDGSRYYPAFPYPNFTKMTRADILAIRAYLATLAPVHNRPPPPELRWPLNYRAVMRSGIFCSSGRAHSSRTSRKARNGIAAVISSPAPRIAADATRPGTCSAPTGVARPMAAAWCRAGSRRGWTAPIAAA